MELDVIRKEDIEVANLIEAELKRQQNTIELIASENFTSTAVMAAQGSVLTNKYAEGKPYKRFYNGCENVDKIEELAVERCKKLFGCDHANVQPHSGAQANMAVFLYALKYGDTVMGMDLSNGGHLTHGSPVNFSGLYFNIVSYGVNENGEIDYDELEKLAVEKKPKLIIAGASNYSKIIDFRRFREIADKVGAYLMADIAHIAALVAGGVHPSPVPYADFVTTTTHKTLRGPRGGIIMCKEEHAQGIDKAVFPGIQGGPLEHVIAAKAVAFGEALAPEFQTYAAKIVENAKTLAAALMERGFYCIGGGTENHLILVDVYKSFGLDGKVIERTLDEIGLTLNANAIPNDTLPPFKPSGIRLGTPAITTRGMGEAEILRIADWMKQVADICMRRRDGEDIEIAKPELARLREEVREMALQFPLPSDK